MKDSSNRYWCVKCGEADQKKKSGLLGETCANCGNRYASVKLTKMGASKICGGCLKKQNQGPGLMVSLKSGKGAGTDKGRLIKMLVFLGVAAAAAVWRFSTLHGG